MNGIRNLCRTGLLFVLLLGVISMVLGTIQVEVDGQALSFSEAPRQMNGRTMVPLRGIFEALGAQVNWDASSRLIIATKGDINVQLVVGDRRATVNGRTIVLDVPALIINGSTMVPLRFVSEALGADVKWFEAAQTVTITSGQVSNTDYGTIPFPPGNELPDTTNQNNQVPPTETYIAPEPVPIPVQNNDISTDQGFSYNEVRNLVAPIALYPDPLLAILLPASTYLDQVFEAQRMNLGNNERAIDEQNWDISVKALAHYPSLLRMMSDDPDWATALGQVYVEQPQDVMDAIQMLREEARANGVLRSNREQRVYLEGNYVRIVPEQTNIIYIPQYDPDVVYVQQRRDNNQDLLLFSLGLIIGSWLSNDTDWAHHRVYNHGWHGGGWIARARPHVTINRIYTNNSDRPAVVNRSIMLRQINRNKVRDYHLPPRIAPTRPSLPNEPRYNNRDQHNTTGRTNDTNIPTTTQPPTSNEPRYNNRGQNSTTGHTNNTNKPTTTQPPTSNEPRYNNRDQNSTTGRTNNTTKPTTTQPSTPGEARTNRRGQNNTTNEQPKDTTKPATSKEPVTQPKPSESRTNHGQDNNTPNQPTNPKETSPAKQPEKQPAPSETRTNRRDNNTQDQSKNSPEAAPVKQPEKQPTPAEIRNRRGQENATGDQPKKSTDPSNTVIRGQNNKKDGAAEATSKKEEDKTAKDKTNDAKARRRNTGH